MVKHAIAGGFLSVAALFVPAPKLKTPEKKD
jgi:hypothetical protein